MSNFTSRERVAAALDHREADRVPIDVGGSRVSGISAIGYKNLLKTLGRSEEIKLYDIKQQLAMVSLEIAEILGSDIVQLTRLSPTTGMSFFKIDRWTEGKLTDGSPCLVPEGYEPVLKEDGSVEIMHDGKLCARRPSEASTSTRSPYLLRMRKHRRTSMHISGPIPGRTGKPILSKQRSSGCITEPIRLCLRRSLSTTVRFWNSDRPYSDLKRCS